MLLGHTEIIELTGWISFSVATKNLTTAKFKDCKSGSLLERLISRPLLMILFVFAVCLG